MQQHCKKYFAREKRIPNHYFKQPNCYGTKFLQFRFINWFINLKNLNQTKKFRK